MVVTDHDCIGPRPVVKSLSQKPNTLEIYISLRQITHRRSIHSVLVSILYSHAGAY